MNPTNALRTVLRRWRRWCIAAISLVLLYAVAGFLILPWVLKSMIPNRLGQLLGREVSVEKVRTNPFTLSITLDGFQIKDPDGSALLSWDRLYVNAELWPLLKKQVAFKLIDLQQPRIRVVLQKGGQLNFSDIIDRLNKNPEPNPAPSDSSPLKLDIGRLRVTGAQLAFLDKSQAEPFSTTLGPITIDLDRFQTERDTRSPYAFKGRTEAGEEFAWSGTLGVQPLRSAGSLELGSFQIPKYAPYYEKQVAFTIKRGTLSTRASYEFEWSENRHTLKLVNGTLALRDIALQEKNQQEPSILSPSIEVAGINADVLISSADVASLTLKDGIVRVQRDPEGHLNLQRMFTPTQKPADTKPSNFKVHLQDAYLSNYGVQVEDRVPKRPVELTLSRIEGHVQDISLDPEHASPVELALHIGDKGSFHANGTVLPLKATGDLTLKLDGLELPPLDPYLDSFVDTRLSRGQLAVDGHAKFSFKGAKDDGFHYAGDMQIKDFEARDGAQNEPFLRWKQLRILGSDFRTAGLALTIKNVDWTEPEARLVMAQDGGSNVTRALRVAPTGPVAAMVPPSPATGPNPVVRIARMAIKNGRLSFIDRSVEPNAALLLSELNGIYTGLSTEAQDATLADFSGKAGGFAPITIQGKAMPLQHDKDTDVVIKIVGTDLTDFSPYTIKYLGYTTREGKLNVDAHVQIKERKLNIEDKVVLDRMYLGDKVDSPDATHLPVKLGLALLRDRKGVIELDVPIDGSLDDPDIHYGKMVWKAILNVLGKIVTSPFTLISKMFGSGGEDLSAVVFPAGESTISPAELKKVEVLIKALAERPELKLELAGTTDPKDELAFKEKGLESLLKRLKWNAKKVKMPATPEEEIVAPAEREALVRTAYDAAFPPPKGTKVEPPPPVEMEKRLLDTIPFNANDLRQLSDARNKAVIESLISGGQVDQTRLFVVQGNEASKAGGPKVYFTLR
jgi:uncharacterized protein involved in outer membrane biogenesis